MVKSKKEEDLTRRQAKRPSIIYDEHCHLKSIVKTLRVSGGCAPPHRSLEIYNVYMRMRFSKGKTHTRPVQTEGSYSVEDEEDDSLPEELEPMTGSPSTTSAPPHFVIARKLWHPMQKDTADLQGVHLE